MPRCFFSVPVVLLLNPLHAPPAATEDSGTKDTASRDLFVDVARQAGLDFVHVNGMRGELYMPETVGSGGALFDYDGDGDLDVYLVQSGPLAPVEPSASPGRLAHGSVDRLYRNDLVRGGKNDGETAPASGGRLRFTDVTEDSGIRGSGYGMGVATGDFDNDGWVDLYVTNFGPNQLWRNNGDGTFSDRTREAGVSAPAWSVSATFLDFDRDGWLDLYVGDYVEFTFELHKVCRTAGGARDYCGPASYRGLPDRLFRNRGDGSFEDVTSRAGLRSKPGAALGVVAADLNNDDWVDLYVANDGVANFLWLNQGDGRFRDEALLAGGALNAQGRPEASMGIDAGDADGDGDLDLVLSHFTGETHTLYVNDGSGLFEDKTTAAGLGAPTRRATGFGIGWLDFDNDGCLDLYAANGAVKAIEALLRQGDPHPLHQPNQLFQGLCDGRFQEVTERGGTVFELSEVSRGVAFGDVDNDGDSDILLVNNHGPVRLLLNQVGSARRWLGIRAVTRGSPSTPFRDRAGARVSLERPGRPTLWRHVRTDGSYASAHDPRVLFGLGEDPSVKTVRIRWPGGEWEEWRELPVDRYATLVQGTGTRVP